MSIYCLVDLKSGEVRRLKSLIRVAFPDGTVAFSVKPGHIHPPQYDGEDGPPPAFLVKEAVVVERGSGAVEKDDPPVYDPDTGAVTIVRILSEAPPSAPPLSDVLADLLVENGTLTREEIEARTKPQARDAR